MSKWIFRGTDKVTRNRLEGTGVNQVDGELYLLDGDKTLCSIERTSLRIVDKDRYKDFNNPVTSAKDLSELQNRIMETVISFCKERKLTDVDRFDFSTDGLQSSIAYGKWIPSTDSSISAYGYEEDEYKKIGEWM
jgi:hypothetical protein